MNITSTNTESRFRLQGNPQGKKHQADSGPADVFVPSPTGSLETIAMRSQIHGFDADHKLSSNMGTGVTIESPALGGEGTRLELGRTLWFSKAVLVVDGTRQELQLKKLPRQDEWDFGGYQAQLPSGKQLEIRSCLTHSELLARRFGVTMKVTDPPTNTKVELEFRDSFLARDLNGQTAAPRSATAALGCNSIKVENGEPTLEVRSGNLIARSSGAQEETRTEFADGGYTVSWPPTDKFPPEKVAAVKSEIVAAVAGAFHGELK